MNAETHKMISLLTQSKWDWESESSSLLSHSNFAGEWHHTHGAKHIGTAREVGIISVIVQGRTPRALSRC